jgi:hypothetical protein
MKYIFVLFGSFFLVACATSAPTSDIKMLSQDTYEISRSGGWGYDLRELKKEVKSSAELFANSAGKDMVVMSESTKPDDKVSTYPAYDDTYTLQFRLVDRKK